MLHSLRSRIFAAQIAVVALAALCAGLAGWLLTSDAVSGEVALRNAACPQETLQRLFGKD